MKSALQRHSFLILLALSLGIGFVFCQPLRLLAELDWLKWAIVLVTMFAMAWPLQFGALRDAILKPVPALVGLGINFVWVPILGWGAMFLLGSDLGLGLLIACCVPSTLATGPVWTRRAGGDDNISMVITILTNGLCFIITPFLVFSFTGTQVPDELFVPTIWKLLIFVVLPIVIAQALRLEKKSAFWVTRNKAMFGKIAQTGVLLMTTLGAVQTGLRTAAESSMPFGALEFGGMLILVIAVHTTALFTAKWVTRIMGMPPAKRIAVAISGSQKTMMIGLSISISLEVSILPMIAFHALQLLVDTIIVDRHRRRYVEEPSSVTAPEQRVVASEPR